MISRSRMGVWVDAGVGEKLGAFSLKMRSSHTPIRPYFPTDHLTARGVVLLGSLFSRVRLSSGRFLWCRGHLDLNGDTTNSAIYLDL